MEASEIGPITQAMYERDEGQGPPVIGEWGAKLRAPGDYVALWTGVIKREWGDLGFGCMTHRFEGADPMGPALRDVPAAAVERLFSPLGHEGRVRIMQALSDGPLSSSDLSSATGYQGGALYHHLKELQYAAYLTQQDGRYRLTELGLRLFLMAASMANELIVDRGDEGLAISRKWQEHLG